MPIFFKKDKDEEQTEEIISQIKEMESTGESTPAPARPHADATQTQTQQTQIKIKERKELPAGTITAKVIINSQEFATFTITPEIYSDSLSVLKEVLSMIEKPELKINSNCGCAWCKEKLNEIEKFLQG